MSLHIPFHRKETEANYLAFHVGSRAQVDAVAEKMRQWGARIYYEETRLDTVFTKNPHCLKIEVATPGETA